MTVERTRLTIPVPVCAGDVEFYAEVSLPDDPVSFPDGQDSTPGNQPSAPDQPPTLPDDLILDRELPPPGTWDRPRTAPGQRSTPSSVAPPEMRFRSKPTRLAFDFDGVRDTIRAIGAQLAEVWEHVRPDEARVEFGLALTARAGKLTGMIVEGGGSASLNVTLVWKRGDVD